MTFPNFQPAGDSAILVTFANTIDLAANRTALGLAQQLSEARLPGIGSIVPGYVTLLVSYDPLVLGYAVVVDLLHGYLRQGQATLSEPRLVSIPVVYGGEEGPDLGFVAQHNGLSVQEVIQIHTRSDYPVYMMGFTPGFPYLGGLDARIAAPRMETPRSRVPAGSVGIAGMQTGVYPVDSPGGWRIIGRTELRLFDLTSEPPFLLMPGDVVRFVAVER